MLGLIKEYHYFAPAMLALREPHVPRRWEEPAMATFSVPVLMRAVRRRLGTVLLRFGGHRSREPLVTNPASMAATATP